MAASCQESLSWRFYCTAKLINFLATQNRKRVILAALNHQVKGLSWQPSTATSRVYLGSPHPPSKRVILAALNRQVKWLSWQPSFTNINSIFLSKLLLAANCQENIYHKKNQSILNYTYIQLINREFYQLILAQQHIHQKQHLIFISNKIAYLQDHCKFIYPTI